MNPTHDEIVRLAQAGDARRRRQHEAWLRLPLAMTAHAERRWAERCAGLEPRAEWLTRRRAGKRLLAAIRAACPAHAHQVKRNHPECEYCVSEHWVVFVIRKGIVRTVFRRAPA